MEPTFGGYPTLDADATAAVTTWLNAVPQLTWLKVATPITPDYIVREDPDSTTCLGGVGCHRVTDWDDRPVENAFYILKGEIVVISAQRFASTAGFRAELAHEFGHAYGLAERYIDDLPATPTPDPTTFVDCNPNETTLMDDMRCDPVMDWLVHCDGLEAPASIDISRVNAYYGQGDTADRLASVNGSVATYTWHHLAWSEHHQRLLWQFQSGSSWVTVTTEDFYDNIGVHRLTEDRVLQKSYDRRNYSFGPGVYRLCVLPYFAPYDHYGDAQDMFWCWWSTQPLT